MDSKSLMIGDWVYDKVLKSNAKVEALQLLTIKCDIHTLKHIYDEFEPVKLTPEILEKNGWKKHATYGNAEDKTLEEIYMLYQHSFEVVFDNKEAISIRHFVSEEDDGYDKLLIEYRDNGYKPMYIHTLQHALRICGLKELADNFEV